MKEKELSNQNQVIWNNILNDLSLIYSDEVFQENFAYMKKPYKIENGIFFLLVENDFIKRKISNFYIDKIEEISKKYSEEKIFFEFISKKEIKNDLVQENNDFLENKKINFNSFHQGNLDPEYTFENFVSGESNNFAFQMAKKVAESNKFFVNPLYIFGSVGLGKTHLMQAIGNYFLKKNPKKKVLYIKADSFIEDFTHQLKKEKMEDFNNKYRNIDVLLIDDIQMMSEAKRTQMEFFKLFDYLNLNKKQIVITSDKPISELNDIMERLTNRFKAGLVVDVKKPDSKHRLNILRKKFFEIQGNSLIKKEILEFISSNFYDNIREMEGALLRLMNYTNFHNMEINLKNTINSLEPLLKTKKKPLKEELDFEKIKSVLSEVYNIEIRDFVSKKRYSNLTLPRCVAIYFMKNIQNISYKNISFLFKRKYSTIVKSFKKIEKQIAVDKQLRNILQLVSDKIN
ncbi:chromosomal replication initiator protein DnaA [Texas Phoenix palm phytoplasma]|uniref:Chromosomal replication initiator protein DnaA n=1 Tax=Texas Phoenix palm phytoplasma TaxID=176709 RepID=A0ABS5BI17_9MOLU|nr:chromosomal replication initiator protein DnaA [Texas Phoenix palm phytoplasma]MBP3059228.1 chromosomal replication initiator protein DnaA [Texas Phoenix palm phytoplasma]